MSSTMNQLHTGAPVVKRAGGTITGTTPGAIWTPASGKKVRLRGIALRARVTTDLVGATAGDPIWLADTTVATPLLQLGRVVSATDVATTEYGFVYFGMPGGGYTLAAADGPLVVVTGATIGTGVIVVRGFVWGDEVL